MLHIEIISKIFLITAAVLHVIFYLIESFFWMNPKVYTNFGVLNEDNAKVIRVFTFNQGFYNLFLSIGAFLAFYFWQVGDPNAEIMIWYSCLFMIGAALVLLFSAPRSIVGALIQGLPPLLALIFY